MDYYQSRTPQQYSVSSNSAAAQTQSASNYLYGTTSNSMYYQQPSGGMQQTYGSTPQHYSTGMNSAQSHAQPAATHSHSSHWNSVDYPAVQQQTASQPSHQQQRRTQPHQQGSSGYNSYRSGGQLQQESSNTTTMGMGRPTHSHVLPQVPPQIPQQDLPLRMVVEAKYVGAIIGQGGGNIREISKESKARCVVDVQRAMRDQDGNIEKVISILGQPENCSKACVKILEVIQKEIDKDETEKPMNEVVLKLRAHNQLVGRLIGKQGSTIKKIMQDTGSVIFVSNSEPANPMGSTIPPMYDVLQMERTITVRAQSIQEVSAAEQRISAKLRQSFETDIASRLQQFPGYPGMGMPGMPGMINPIGDAYAALASGMNMRNSNQSSQTKSVRIYVPNNMVGAIIGTKGANIRNIMRNSGAHIKIEGGDRREKADSEEEGRDRELDKKDEEERMVTISGTDLQQYRAQFWIYQRVAEQTNHMIDEVKLRTEVQVPAKLVGRIIGKGGQNVRELQRITGAQVKIPDEAEEAGGSAEAHRDKHASVSDDDVSSVRIIGNFQSAQSVQFRIAHVCADFAKMSMSGERRERHYRDDRGEKEGASSPGSQ